MNIFVINCIGLLDWLSGLREYRGECTGGYFCKMYCFPFPSACALYVCTNPLLSCAPRHWLVMLASACHPVYSGRVAVQCLAHCAMVPANPSPNPLPWCTINHLSLTIDLRLRCRLTWSQLRNAPDVVSISKGGETKAARVPMVLATPLQCSRFNRCSLTRLGPAGKMLNKGILSRIIIYG